MGRPLIGLTTYAEPQRLSGREVDAVTLPAAYVRSVNAAGGRAVLIPSDAAGADVLDHLDGILLCGGSDVGPRHYGEDPHPAVVSRPLRDDAELLFLRAALDRDMPILGVCRGLQLMAVVAGGRLHQHLPEALGSQRHRPAGEPRHGRHQVTLQSGTLLHKILGDEVTVNSFHHQGIADPGTLTVAGHCPDDGLIEAAEDSARTFAVGVQWHPEDMPDPRLFAALVEAAAEYAGDRPVGERGQSHPPVAASAGH